MRHHPRQSGFSLIELLIVVVIIGILGAIGIPSYQSHLEKSRRSEATTNLLELASLQERYYLEHSEYAKDLSDLGWEGNYSKPDQLYELRIGKSARHQFAFVATPNSRGLQAGDEECDEIHLISTGERRPAACW